MKAKKKVTAKKAAKPSKATKGPSGTAAVGGQNAYYLPKGVIVQARGPIGKTEKVGLQAFRVKLLYDNARAKVDKRMTDDDIAAAVRKEFPKVDQSAEHMKAFWVNVFRSKYNNGDYTGGIAPKTKSVRFDELGRPCPMLPRAFWTFTIEGRRSYADCVDAMNARMEKKAKKQGKAKAKPKKKLKAKAVKAARVKRGDSVKVAGKKAGKVRSVKGNTVTVSPPKKKAKKRKPTAKRAKKPAEVAPAAPAVDNSTSDLTNP